jgi:hypothetical protein
MLYIRSFLIYVEIIWGIILFAVFAFSPIGIAAGLKCAGSLMNECVVCLVLTYYQAVVGNGSVMMYYGLWRERFPESLFGNKAVFQDVSTVVRAKMLRHQNFHIVPRLALTALPEGVRASICMVSVVDSLLVVTVDKLHGFTFYPSTINSFYQSDFCFYSATAMTKSVRYVIFGIAHAVLSLVEGLGRAVRTTNPFGSSFYSTFGMGVQA